MLSGTDSDPLDHTEFPVYFFDDYTEKMTAYTDKWKELGLSFDAVATGFLGSEAQIEIVMDMIRKLESEETFVVVDPVMGDMDMPMRPTRRRCASR